MTCTARRTPIEPKLDPTRPSPLTRAARAIRPSQPLQTTRSFQPTRRDAARLSLVAAIEAAPAPRGFDWAEVREGAREVFLTLAATLLLGLGWAALETGWHPPAQAPSPSRSADAALTGYASLEPTAR